jgi:trigger factor
MNITKEMTGDLTATLKINLEALDYQEKVDKSLKDYQKKANIPGFRAGKVPMGMIKKMVGNSVIAEEINKILVDALYKYLDENKIETLGNPLPAKDKNTEIDWETQKTFDFYYDLGLAPEIKIDLAELKDITEYSLKINEEDIEKNIADLLKRYGKYETPEVADESCMLYVEFSELDADGNIIEGGIKHNTFIYLDQLKDKKILEKLLELKKEETMKVDLKVLFESTKDIAYKLNIPAEKAESLVNDFQIKLIGTSKIIPAALDNELFEKLYGKDAVKDENEFRERVKSDMAKNYNLQADKKYFNDIATYLIENIEMKLPEEFLKRWLFEVNEGKFSKEQIDNEFDVYKKSLKWQLIENKLLLENQITVSEQDAKDYIIDNFIKPYGANKGGEPESDAALNDIAQNVLKDKKESEKIYERIYNERMIEVFKKTIISNKKEVDINEFIKLATEKEK